MLTDIIENAFNHLLQSDSYSKDKLATMAGQSVGFDIRGTALNYIATITNEGLSISKDSLEQADCILRGTPLALIRYMNAKQVNPSTNHALGVEIEGDLEFARNISTVFRKLDVDWEDVFSQLIGDLPAHQINRAISHFSSVFNRSRESASAHLHYIISERLDQIVAREEAELFYNEVDQLSARVDQIEQKINRLTRADSDA